MSWLMVGWWRPLVVGWPVLWPGGQHHASMPAWWLLYCSEAVAWSQDILPPSSTLQHYWTLTWHSQPLQHQLATFNSVTPRFWLSHMNTFLNKLFKWKNAPNIFWCEIIVQTFLSSLWLKGNCHEVCLLLSMKHDLRRRKNRAIGKIVW